MLTTNKGYVGPLATGPAALFPNPPAPHPGTRNCRVRGGEAGDLAGSSGISMFVYYYVHLGRPFRTVEPRLLELANGLVGLAAAAYREGEEIRARLGIGDGYTRIGKTVTLRPGEPSRGSVETSIPIVWEATGTPGLFPRMEGELVVADLGEGLTQVAIRGSYQPPLGVVGRALDRTLFHRVAEASVKQFLDRIALALDSGVGASHPVGGEPPLG